jgi:oxygen-dependent protoporphyrinogen oxidase
VGGGIAGLASAWALSRAGHEVALLESEPRLGGKIRTERDAGFLFEAGPDSFLTTKPHAVALCRELGLGAELVEARPGKAYVWARGTLHPIPAGTRLLPTRLGPLIASRLFSLAEKSRIVADLLLPGGAAAGDESLGRLVTRRMGRAMVERLAGPLLAGIHAADPDRLSVEATFPILLEAERRHGSLIRGLRAIGPAAPRAAFATLAGGLGTLVDRLAERLAGADLRTGARVRELARAGDAWKLELDHGTIETDGIVLAVPAHVAATLLAGVASRAAALLAGVEWVSTAVITLGYRAADAPALSGHGFVVALDQPARITGCTWVSSKWPGRAPEGHVLLRAYLGHALQPVDLEADDVALAGSARADLARAIGLAADPVLEDVARWPSAMPQLAVGHRARVAAVERELARLPGVALAGAGVRGSGIPGSIAQGLAAAAKVQEGFLQPERGSLF